MSAPEAGGRLPAFVFALLGAAVALGTSSQADAAETRRYDYQGAAGICQPANATYAEKIRSRPLAVVNEGTTDAYVTCALRGDARPGGRGVTRLIVEAGAPGGQSGVVSCTFVDGAQRGGSIDAIYRNKTAFVTAGSRGVALTWVPSEIAGAPEHIFRPGVQCMLPPGIALHYLAVVYDEDIGG